MKENIYKFKRLGFEPPPLPNLARFARSGCGYFNYLLLYFIH